MHHFFGTPCIKGHSGPHVTHFFGPNICEVIRDPVLDKLTLQTQMFDLSLSVLIYFLFLCYSISEHSTFDNHHSYNQNVLQPRSPSLFYSSSKITSDGLCECYLYFHIFISSLSQKFNFFHKPIFIIDSLTLESLH